jgi:cyanate permease
VTSATPATPARLDRRLVAVMAVACGAAVANLVLVAILASWGVLALSSSSVAGIVLGLVLIDFGVQGQNVLSQHVIYGLGAEHASRVTIAYVTSNFLGGALGSAAGSVAWGAGGWSAVCAVGAVTAGLALALWLTDRCSPRALCFTLASRCRR